MALATLIDHGCKVFLEVGPHPIMQKYVNENLRALKSPGMSVATLKRNSDDQKSLWEAYCTAHVLGSSLDFRKLFRGYSQHVQLPLYPWQRERHWHSTTPET